MHKSRILLICFGLHLPSLPAYGQSYFFVDAELGNDAWSGTSATPPDPDCTENCVGPWQTIARINSSDNEITAGSNIYLKSGQRWREQLVIPSSGEDGNPVTYSCYTDDQSIGICSTKPELNGFINTTSGINEFNNGPACSSDFVNYPNTINGEVVYTSTRLKWTRADTLSNTNDGEVWYLAPDSLPSGFEHNAVYLASVATIRDSDGDQQRLIHKLAKDGTFSDREYKLLTSESDFGNWAFYLRMDAWGGGTPCDADFDIYVAIGGEIPHLIDTNHQHHLVIENLSLFGAGIADRPAIHMNGSNHVAVRNNQIAFNTIAIDGKSKGIGPGFNDSEISANDIHDNSQNGIYIRGESSRNWVHHNRVNHNFTHLNDLAQDRVAIGISGPASAPQGRTGNIIEYNEIDNNGNLEANSLEFVSASANRRYADPVLAVYSSYRTLVRYNNIHHNHQGAAYFTSNVDESTFSHNLVHHNISRNNHLLRIGIGSTGVKENAIIHNTIYGNVVEAEREHNGIPYAALTVQSQARIPVIQNNIFSNNQIKTLYQPETFPFPARLVSLYEETAQSTFIIDNNLYWDNSASDYAELPISLIWYWKHADGSTSPWTTIAECYSEGFLSWKQCLSPYNKEVSSIEADPMLSLPSAGDFHIGFATSQAIDSGAQFYPYSGNDGNPRILGININADGTALDYYYDYNLAAVNGLPDIGAMEDADKDSDGFAATSDCDDDNSSIFPGVNEIRFDGVDQDCNGYDLTIDIALAEYITKAKNNKRIVVWATSSLNENADLVLNGWGPMSWNGIDQRWEFLTEMTLKPATVTVSGVEGEWTSEVQ